MLVPFTVNRLARVAWLTFVTATKPKTFQPMIAPGRLATAPDHFAASAGQALPPCPLVQVVTTHPPGHLIQLWSALTRPITTTTPLATAKRLAPANQEDFTSTLSNRMVRRSGPSHLIECFPPHRRRHQAVITIYTRTVATPHRLHHLPIKSITAAGGTVRWSRGRSRCVATSSRTALTALAYASKAEGKPVGSDFIIFEPMIHAIFFHPRRHWRLHFSHRRSVCSRAVRSQARRHHPRSQWHAVLRDDSWWGTRGKWNVVCFPNQCACWMCRKILRKFTRVGKFESSSTWACR